MLPWFFLINCLYHLIEINIKLVLWTKVWEILLKNEINDQLLTHLYCASVFLFSLLNSSDCSFTRARWLIQALKKEITESCDIIGIKYAVFTTTTNKHFIQTLRQKILYNSQSRWRLMILTSYYSAAVCVSWLHACASVYLSSVPVPFSVKQNVLVLWVGNLIPALQPPHCFPHVFRLKWWRVTPLLTDIQCC